MKYSNELTFAISILETHMYRNMYRNTYEFVFNAYKYMLVWI